MTEAERRTAALAGLGFGAAAAAYSAGRPGYPADAVAWLVGDARDVVDVGAGTGKLTVALATADRQVTAVDPDPGMLAELRRQVPGVDALVGSAESLPLPDGSADAVVLGQAWHWVDVPAASAETARVLRPGGVLGLIWNVRDESEPWVAELGRVMHGSDAERLLEADGVRVAAPFGPLRRRESAWTRRTSVDVLVAMAASRSYVIALEPGDRDDLLEAVRALATSEADLDGRVALPYRTIAFRTRRP